MKKAGWSLAAALWLGAAGFSAAATSPEESPWAGRLEALALEAGLQLPSEGLPEAAVPPAAMAAPVKAVDAEEPLPTADENSKTQRQEISAGELLMLKLPCNPTTGYEWELESIDRRIVKPVGEVDFLPSDDRGPLGTGGTCVLGLRGVKPGNTEAVLAYRRHSGRGRCDEILKVELTVVPQKQSPPSHRSNS